MMATNSTTANEDSRVETIEIEPGDFFVEIGGCECNIRIEDDGRVTGISSCGEEFPIHDDYIADSVQHNLIGGMKAGIYKRVNESEVDQ